MTKQEKAALVSIAANSVLTIMKFILASITASIALLAEAYHSFADIFCSVMVFLAVRADERSDSPSPAAQPIVDEEQASAPSKPKIFSPGNWGNKVAMVIGILLVLAAFNIFEKVRQSGPIPIRYPLTAAVVIGFLAVCSYVLYRFETSVGEDTRSSALIADGRHAQTDMLASALVVLALIAARFGLGLDKIAAGIIASYILISAIHVLTQAIRSYSAATNGREVSGGIIYEDILFSLAYRTYSKLDQTLWTRLNRIPGLKGPMDLTKRRFAFALIGLMLLVVLFAYALSGVYVVQPAERAIVERFGRPLSIDSPVAPGLHYHWPWPVERIKKADVEQIKRLTIGYKTGGGEYLILWTNKHYLREYSIITGEGPYLDVAMNVHYRINDLYRYLFSSTEPDGAIEKIGYQVLRETLGTRPFFSSITAERDALEKVILTTMQRRIDELSLGLLVQNVCFRDLHPPTQVASAFEDVVSAQEDYETYIEEAHGYRKDLLPRARASAATNLNDAASYRYAQMAQSEGKAQSFVLQQEAYRKAEDLTRVRMVLETVEQALSDTPKYIISPNDNGESPDLWLPASPFFSTPYSKSAGGVEGQQKLETIRKTFRINEEEDLIDAVKRYQQERRGTER